MRGRCVQSLTVQITDLSGAVNRALTGQICLRNSPMEPMNSPIFEIYLYAAVYNAHRPVGGTVYSGVH